MPIGAITLGIAAGFKPSAPLFNINMEFAGDSSYPTGGSADFMEAVRDAIQTQMAAMPDANVRGRIDVSGVSIIGFECGQYVPWYDAANDKLFVRDGGHATWQEVPNGTNLSTTTFKLTVACY
jgi:hypothetical protein